MDVSEVVQTEKKQLGDTPFTNCKIQRITSQDDIPYMFAGMSALCVMYLGGGGMCRNKSVLKILYLHYNNLNTYCKVCEATCSYL